MTSSPALFLDRDGVINVDKDYVYQIENFEFVDGIFDVVKQYHEAGYLVIVVTNQSGIARGYYSEQDFLHVSAWMTQQFEAHGGNITHVYYCPHHPEITGSCRCRKPSSGMLIDAKNAYHIDMTRSLMIGDKERDIEAAIGAGIENTILLSHHEHPNTKARRIIHSLKELLC
jgi:D-glycero-D-manno-heptose 1,7-bisphosphate phosphatase